MSTNLPGSGKLARYGSAIVAAWCFSGLVQLLRGWWLIDQAGRPVFSNFLCFWAAGKLAAGGQAAASYSWHAISQVEAAAVAPGLTILPWLYPPSFLLVMAPLSHLSYLGACALWLVATGIAYVMVMRLILPHRLSILLALAAPTTLFNVIETETGFMVAALIGFTLTMLERRPVLAGVALGLLTMKPQFGLIFPILLIISGNWRVFWSATVTAVVIAALTRLAFGADIWQAYVHAIPTIGAADLGQGDRNRLMAGGTIAWCDIQTWFSVARYLGALDPVPWIVYAVTATISVLAICWLWRQPVSAHVKAAAVSVGVFLAMPYVMSYDMVVLTVAIAFMLRENLASGFRRGDIEVYVAALALPLYPLFADGIMPLLPLSNALLLGWIVRRGWTLQAVSVAQEQRGVGVTIGAGPAG
jgi:arabinofuranan 3-O-arabinosyltransferase